MKAILWTNYGIPYVLKPGEVEKPVPKDNEVLVRIYAASVTAGDCEIRSLKFPFFLRFPMRIFLGFRKPKRITIPGMDFAGIIESTGKDVKSLKTGDRIFGSNGFGMGAYAEYMCRPEKPGEIEGPIAILPADMTFKEAAAVPTGGCEALHFIRKGNIQSGETILINGAGGSIGTFAVQLARYYGAKVIAVDRTEKFEMLHSIGADQVIDYTQEDFTKTGKTYDIIFDVVGKSSFSRSMRSLNKNGRYLLANPGLSHMIRGLLTSKRSNKKVIFGTGNPKKEDLIFLIELIKAGKLKPVIDKCYPLGQIIEAHTYVETGQKKGNVIITVAHDQD